MNRIVAILMLVCWQSIGANWYVDNALVGSENTGVSWVNAWTNWSSVGALSGGDTLYVSGGITEKVYYWENVPPYGRYLVGSGTSASAPVTITAGTNSGHTGKVIFDGQGELRSATNAANDVHMFGFSGSYILLDGGPNTNFVFRNWYNTNYSGNSTAQYQSAPLLITLVDNTVFTRLIFTNCGVCFGVSDSTNFTASYITARRIRGNHAISIIPPQPAPGFDVCTVAYCDVETCTELDGSRGADGINIGSGTTIRNCRTISVPTQDVIGYQHPDSSQVFGQQFIKLYANTFFAPPNACWEGQPGWEFVPAPPQTNCHDIVIANNLYLFWNTNYTVSRIMENGGNTTVSTYSNWFFLNNTFVDFALAQCMGLAWEQAAGPVPDNQPTVTNVCFYNNSVIHCGNAMGHWFSFAPYVNTNFNSNGVSWAKNVVANGPNRWFEATNSIASFLATGNWSGAYHAVPDSTTNLPTFVSYTVYSTNNDMRVTAADTAARAQGTNLTSLFTAIGIPATDRDGNARPAWGAWTIGAYEFRASGSKVTTPGKLTIVGKVTL